MSPAGQAMDKGTGSCPEEALMPSGGRADLEPSGGPGLQCDTDLESSGNGCQKCTNASDLDSVLTQRRSMGDIKSPRLRSPTANASTSQQASWLPTVAVWIIAVLGLAMLVFILFAFEMPSDWLHYLTELPAEVYGSIVPIGANYWIFQWKHQGKLDPRPLWDPAMMGSRAQWIHGSSTGLAQALNASTSRVVAVVGNGPISDSQRREINESDFVVRFNAMNSRREEERVDLWVVRNNHLMPYLYWGFEQLTDEEIVKVLEKAKAVLFLSDFKPLTRSIKRKAEFAVADFVKEWFSSARDEQLHQVDITAYWQLYAHLFSKTGKTKLNTTDVMPSSGLLGILAVLEMIPKDAEVNLYGFNWNVRSYVQHMMSTEELIVQAVKQSYKGLKINPTACNGLYHCNQICDTAQFRLVVDEENCNRQIARAEAGGEARFIDLHTTQHLEWHDSLLAELKAKAKAAGVEEPSDDMLESMAKEIAEGRNRNSDSKEEELPQMYHQKVNLAKLVAADRPRRVDKDSRRMAETKPKGGELQSPLVENKSSQMHNARKLRRPQAHR